MKINKGDVFTINELLDFNAMMCVRDCTKGKEYTIAGVGNCGLSCHEDGDFDSGDLFFYDDLGDTVQLPVEYITLIR